MSPDPSGSQTRPKKALATSAASSLSQTATTRANKLHNIADRLREEADASTKARQELALSLRIGLVTGHTTHQDTRILTDDSLERHKTINAEPTDSDVVMADIPGPSRVASGPPTASGAYKELDLGITPNYLLLFRDHDAFQKANDPLPEREHRLPRKGQATKLCKKAKRRKQKGLVQWAGVSKAKP